MEEKILSSVQDLLNGDVETFAKECIYFDEKKKVIDELKKNQIGIDCLIKNYPMLIKYFDARDFFGLIYDIDEIGEKQLDIMNINQIDSVFDSLLKTSYGRNYIGAHLFDFINMPRGRGIPSLIEDIIDIKELRQTIIDNVTFLITKCPDKDISHLVEMICKFDNGIQIIKENIDLILNKKGDINLLKELADLGDKEIDEKLKAKTQFFIDNSKCKIETIWELNRLNFLSASEQDRYKFLLFLMTVIKSGPKYLIDEQKVSTIFNAMVDNKLDEGIGVLFSHLNGNELNDKIKVIGQIHCTYSAIFKINKYVVKISTQRQTYSCPYHYRIINSLLREEIKNEKGETVFYIEVQRFLDQSNITYNDICDAIEDMENDGIEVTDNLVMQKKTYNFGYLDNWKEMNQIIPTGYGGITNEAGESFKVSESFKRNPSVLLDNECVNVKTKNC